MTGDITQNYHVDLTMQAVGSGAAAQHMQMSARWLGPCPAGSAPGDVTLPGGMVVHPGRTPPAP